MKEELEQKLKKLREEEGMRVCNNPMLQWHMYICMFVFTCTLYIVA